MKGAALRVRLASLRPPAPADSARERALHRATLALGSTREEPAPAPSARRPALHFLGAAAALAVAFALGLRLRPASHSAPAPLAHVDGSDAVADSLRLLAQIQQLFPDRLNAVIDRDGALQLDLAPSAAALVGDQPILVEFTHAGHSVRILGFSGRSVEVELDGRLVRFAPLLTGGGSVLLAGENFAWNPGLPPPDALADWNIDARPLASPTL